MPILSFSDEDFQAESDLAALGRSEEIKSDSGRMSRARAFALAKADKLRAAAEKISPTTRKGFNNAVENSKMRQK